MDHMKKKKQSVKWSTPLKECWYLSAYFRGNGQFQDMEENNLPVKRCEGFPLKLKRHQFYCVLQILLTTP